MISGGYSSRGGPQPARRPTRSSFFYTENEDFGNARPLGLANDPLQVREMVECPKMSRSPFGEPRTPFLHALHSVVSRRNRSSTCARALPLSATSIAMAERSRLQISSPS